MLMDSRESSGPSRLRYFTGCSARSFRPASPLDGAVRAFSLLDSYVYGFGIQTLNMTMDSELSPEEYG